MMARLDGILGGIISAGGAIVSSLCCVLPLMIVLLGLGSGAFMATTMKYAYIFVPIGLISVTAGFYLYSRERQRCARKGCHMSGGAWNLGVLVGSALVVAAAVFLTLFPVASSDLLMWATSRQRDATPHPMDMPMGSHR